jgi:TPP-dependent pyruvate/acetoin dehydrogenase alpha subunit
MEAALRIDPKPSPQFHADFGWVLFYNHDYERALQELEKAREGGGPTLIECVTLRMEGHAVHDDAFYVPKEMFEEWAKRDPIERFRGWLRVRSALRASRPRATSRRSSRPARAARPL